MFEVLKVGGVTILEGMVLALFVLLFAWVAFSFMSALAGFVLLLMRARDPLAIEPLTPLAMISSRNAMLLPTYNEDPHQITARLRAMWESISETGYAAQFDWYVLSDSTDPAIWVAEEKAILKLRRETASDRIFYRHRMRNTARKSGNIEDWVKRFGAGYDHMIILDADSLMTGDTIVRLVAGMEQHPGVGLIQDAAYRCQCAVAIRTDAAIRWQALWPGNRLRNRLVARLGRQLLGTQRHHPRARLCRTCQPARTSRAQAVRRPYSQP